MFTLRAPFQSISAHALALVLSAPCGAQTWTETGPDAPQLLPGDVTSGGGPLTLINGALAGPNGLEADLYCIRITDPATFSASTVGLSDLDTQLFLFDSTGKGIAFNDDDAISNTLRSRITGQFVPAAGVYFLGISRYNHKPASAGGNIWADSPLAVERAPDGPGAAGALTGWGGGTGTTTGAYGIALTGATFHFDTSGPGCSPNYAPSASYGAVLAPNSVAIGDFNGDGKPDLATANFGNNTVSVLLGNGNGTFQAALDYDAGDSPIFVAIGDLNADGTPDLAVANFSNSAGVSVLLGNGNGTFQAAVIYGPNDVSTSVAIGDLNGDGRLDLAVTKVVGYLSVLLGNGDGTFQAAVNYGAGSGPASLAIEDLNGDGKPDLAVANNFGNLSVLLGNGNGTFQAAVSYNADNGPQFVAIGDLNGDGRPDLAAPNYNSNNVSVLLGNGNGTFQAAVNYATSNSPYSVAIADLNADGRPDLAVANISGNNVSVLLGNGNGTFQTAVNYAAGDGPISVAIADLNADGRPDLAVANINSNNVSVLLQQHGVPVPIITTQPSLQSVTAGQPASFSVVASTPTGTPTYQWRRNGVNLSNAAPYSGVTTPTLNISAAALATDLALFDCVVTNPCGSIPSLCAVLSVAPCPGDFNGDQTVDLIDLLDFNSDWSNNLGQNCP